MLLLPPELQPVMMPGSLLLPCSSASGKPARHHISSQRLPACWIPLATAATGFATRCFNSRASRCGAATLDAAADLVHGAQHATLFLHDVLPAAVTEPAQHAVLDTLRFKEDPEVRSML